MRGNLRGMFYLLLVLAFVLLSTLKPAHAGQFFNSMPAITNVGGEIPLDGLMVCGLQENEDYAHEAARAVAAQTAGWKHFVLEGTCRSDFVDISAVPDNGDFSIEHVGTSLVITATIADVQGYVIIPLGILQCRTLQKLGRPSCKGAFFFR